MAKLYTSYFKKIEKGIGIKASIARKNPDWICFSKEGIDWLVELAPSKNLLKQYKKKEINWMQYCDIYLSQIQNDNNAQKLLDKISKIILEDNQDITIYCYEKPSDNCHRHLIAKYMKTKYGIETEEI